MRRWFVFFLLIFLCFMGCLVPNVYNSACCDSHSAHLKGVCYINNVKKNTEYCIYANYTDNGIKYYKVSSGKISEIDCSKGCSEVGYCKINDNGIHYVPICEEVKEVNLDEGCYALICGKSIDPLNYIPVDLGGNTHPYHSAHQSFYSSLLNRECKFDEMDIGDFAYFSFYAHSFLYDPLFDNSVFLKYFLDKDKMKEYGLNITPSNRTERFMNYLDISSDIKMQCTFGLGAYCTINAKKSDLNANKFLDNGKYLVKTYKLFNVSYEDIDYDAYIYNLTAAYWHYNSDYPAPKKEFECNSDYDCASGSCGKDERDYRRDFCLNEDGDTFDCYCSKKDDYVYCKPYYPSPMFKWTMAEVTKSDSVNLCCLATSFGTKYGYSTCILETKTGCSPLYSYADSGRYVCCLNHKCVPSSCSKEGSACFELVGGICKGVRNTWCCSPDGCEPYDCLPNHPCGQGMCMQALSNSPMEFVISKDMVFFDKQIDGYIGYSYVAPEDTLIGSKCVISYDLENISYATYEIKSFWDKIKCYKSNSTHCKISFAKLYRIKNISGCLLDGVQPKLSKGYSWCDPIRVYNLHYINDSIIEAFVSHKGDFVVDALLFSKRIKSLLDKGVFPILNFTNKSVVDLSSLVGSNPVIVLADSSNFNYIKNMCPYCLIAVNESEFYKINSSYNKVLIYFDGDHVDPEKVSRRLVDMYKKPSICFIRNKSKEEIIKLLERQKELVRSGLFGIVYFGDISVYDKFRPLEYKASYTRIPLEKEVQCSPCYSEFGCSEKCLNALDNWQPAVCSGEGSCGIRAVGDCLSCKEALNSKSIMCNISYPDGRVEEKEINSFDELEPVYIGALPDGQKCCLGEGDLRYTYQTSNSKGILKLPFVYPLDNKSFCGFDLDLYSPSCGITKPIKDFNVICKWVDKK